LFYFTDLIVKHKDILYKNNRLLHMRH